MLQPHQSSHKHQMQSHSYHTGIGCNDSRFLLLIYSYKNKIMKTKSRNPLKSYLINQQQKISTTFFFFLSLYFKSIDY